MSRHSKNGKSPVCVGAGFVALDVVRYDSRTNGEICLAGGSCGNVLTILAFLGWKSSPVARIGQDPPGAQLLHDFRQWSVDTQFLMLEDAARTPIVFQEIFSNRGGQPQHRFTRNCFLCGEKAAGYRPIRLRDTRTLVDQLPSPAVFYFDRVAPANVALARKANEEGALVVFEPSGVKDPKLFVEALRLAHVFKYSHKRFDSYADVVSEALVPIVVETRGGEGLRVTVRKKGCIVLSEEMPAVPAPRMRDAAGSGDWCTAGFIHSIAKEGIAPAQLPNAGKYISTALRYAQALAALNCAFGGARGVMYAMTKRRLLSGALQIAEGRAVKLSSELKPLSSKELPTEDSKCIVCARPLV